MPCIISDKEIMFSVALVCLFVFPTVCLSVTNITKKVMNELWWNFLEGSRMIKGMWLNLGSDLDHRADCPIENLAITKTNYKRLLMKFSG